MLIGTEGTDGLFGFSLYFRKGIGFQRNRGIADAAHDVLSLHCLCNGGKITARTDLQKAEVRHLQVTLDHFFHIGAAVVDAKAGKRLRQTDVVFQQMLAVLVV